MRCLSSLIGANSRSFATRAHGDRLSPRLASQKCLINMKMSPSPPILPAQNADPHPSPPPCRAGPRHTCPAVPSHQSPPASPAYMACHGGRWSGYAFWSWSVSPLLYTSLARPRANIRSVTQLPARIRGAMGKAGTGCPATGEVRGIVVLLGRGVW